MELHKLLSRQLNRLGLSYDLLPTDLERWQELIEKISKAYVEADQERYLTERSMDLSSHELLSLNKRLEEAQHIAGLGYWVYDRAKSKITLSKELHFLFGLAEGEPIPTFDEFMQMVHEDQRAPLQALVERAFSEGKEYEYEIQMKRPEGNYRWYYIFGRPVLGEENTLVLTGISMDITSRKQAEEELAIINQQLVSMARQIGMADIASATLHNVGNVLSSASVSAELMQETMEHSHHKKFGSIVEMLKEHLQDIGEYLTQDPKGKLIPQYLISLHQYLEEDEKTNYQEVLLLRKQLQHIKDIVGTQKDISSVGGGLREKVSLAEVIDSALQISKNSLKFKEVDIHKSYEEVPPVIIDKNKLLQILVNIIQNAKESVLENEKEIKKEIFISLGENKANKKIVIIVEDNGVGILEENLTKIFSFGFSTKDNGHGFGLHSSAIAAQEIGGAILAETKGIGKGAVFTITLPLIAPD